MNATLHQAMIVAPLKRMNLEKVKPTMRFFENVV